MVLYLGLCGVEVLGEALVGVLQLRELLLRVAERGGGARLQELGGVKNFLAPVLEALDPLGQHLPVLS